MNSIDIFLKNLDQLLTRNQEMLISMGSLEENWKIYIDGLDALVKYAENIHRVFMFDGLNIDNAMAISTAELTIARDVLNDLMLLNDEVKRLSVHSNFFRESMEIEFVKQNSLQ